MVTRLRFILRDHFFYSVIAALVVVIFAGVFSWYKYISSVKEHHQHVQLEARYLARSLEDILEQTEEFVEILGKQVVETSSSGEKVNFNLLEHQSLTLNFKRSVSWMTVGWINKDNKLALKNDTKRSSIDMSFRSYVRKSRQEPWKLHLSRPAIGVRRGLWEIPGGMGITTEVGEYLGIIAVGLDPSEISNKLQQISSLKHISFIVLDSDMRVILQSIENGLDPKTSYFKNILGINCFTHEEGMLKTPFEYKTIQYTYYKKVKNYPYFILTGLDNNYLNKELKAVIIPRLIEFAGMGLFCLLLLYLFYKRIWSLAQISQKAKEVFMRQMKSEMNVPIHTIIGYSEILRKYMRGEIQVGIDKNRSLALIDEIHEMACNIRMFAAPRVLDYTYINVNTVIEECIIIQAQALFTKDVLTRTQLSDNLPLFYADELRFKQIILGLISLCLSSMYERGTIKITTKLKCKDGQETIIIIFEDNGISLHPEDIYRLEEMLQPTGGLTTLDESNHTDYSTIEKLIKLHGGTVQIERGKNKGKIIILHFPCQVINEDIPSNVYRIH